MIKDIPRRDDFYAVGNALLNQAWDEAMSLLIELEEARDWIDAEDEEEYWTSSRTQMATALAIAHQAAEFYLKGRISEVSSFLLIANSAREWPAAERDGNISFSRFRTVDSQDLVRLHDSCVATPFDNAFKSRLELLRVRRNSIMHTVDRNIHVKVGELVEIILEIHETLVGGGWVDFRRNALEESSTGKIFYGDWAEPRLVYEFKAIKGILTPYAINRYFSFNSKQRVYICPRCTWSTCRDHGIEFHSAIIMPNAPDSTAVWCPVCNEGQEVERLDCNDQECRGNVISREWDRCLTCGELQIEES